MPYRNGYVRTRGGFNVFTASSYTSQQLPDTVNTVFCREAFLAQRQQIKPPSLLFTLYLVITNRRKSQTANEQVRHHNRLLITEYCKKQMNKRKRGVVDDGGKKQKTETVQNHACVLITANRARKHCVASKNNSDLSHFSHGFSSIRKSDRAWGNEESCLFSTVFRAALFAELNRGKQTAATDLTLRSMRSRNT